MRCSVFLLVAASLTLAAFAHALPRHDQHYGPQDSSDSSDVTTTSTSSSSTSDASPSVVPDTEGAWGRDAGWKKRQAVVSGTEGAFERIPGYKRDEGVDERGLPRGTSRAEALDGASLEL
ncbi:MAG: hypothetical protein CYPHOPRED_000593 [Cyphobasidiales sp. Tagirdzhanova-0007]|nr:MAG: hypothetical protein CYPHOPRED_000593 [Cyphobasidiales sp. Tagirdzhanova-0007]